MAAATPPAVAEKIGDKSQVETVKPPPMMAPSKATSVPAAVPARGGAEEAGEHNKDESLVELAVKRQRIIALFCSSNIRLLVCELKNN